MKRKRGSDDDEENQPMEENEDDDQPKIKKRRFMGTELPPMTFHEVCLCLHRIEKSKSRKREIVLAFLDANRTRDFYPFLRLMIPDLDRDRGKFGLQDRKLAEIYVDVAMMGEKWKLKLRQWKSRGEKGNSTKFSNHVFNGLLDVGWTPNQLNKKFPNPMTVTEINEWLDSLQRLEKRDTASYTKKLQEIILRLTAIEHLYLVRIILKSMKIGMGKGILHILHEDAKELYSKQPDLNYVCCQIKDGTNLLSNHSIQPFAALKPMLAKRGHPVHLSRFIKSKSDEAVYVESKFDGERVLIHFSSTSTSSPGSSERIEYYTRNGNNYTHFYHIFDDVVKKCLKKRFRNCILDGEMLVYDERLDCLKEFGHNRQHAIDQPDHEHFCYQCFDILFRDGAEITSWKYIDRKKLLHRKLKGKAKKKYFEVVPEVKVVEGESEINTRLRKAVAEGCEGIMLKKSDSIYEFDKRSTWMKYKPYYLQSIDLLIIGCFFGTKFNRLSPSDFLCGIRARNPVENKKRSRRNNDDDDEEIEEDGEKACKFYTFTKVGTGFNKRDLESLQSHLKEHWVKYNPLRPPSWLVGRIPPKQAEKYTPDYVIDDPMNSQVLEVKCDAVVETTKYGMDCTLRHGRAVKVRYDLQWDSCCDEVQIRQFRENLLTAHQEMDKFDFDNQDGDNLNPRKGRRRGGTGRKRMEPTVPLTFQRSIDPSQVEREGTILQGQEFVIYNCDEISKKYDNGTKAVTREVLHKIIASQGGRVIMNPTQGKTTAIIASYECSRVAHVIREKYFDVIRPCWFLEIEEKKRSVPLIDKHLIFATDRTVNDIAQRVDIHGDVYTKKMTVEGFLRHKNNMFTPQQQQSSSSTTTVSSSNNNNNNNNRMIDEEEEEEEEEDNNNRVTRTGGRRGRRPQKSVVRMLEERFKIRSPIAIFRNKRFYLDQGSQQRNNNNNNNNNDDDDDDPLQQLKRKERKYYSKMGVIEMMIRLHSGIVLEHPYNKLTDYIVMDTNNDEEGGHLQRLERIVEGMPKDRIPCAVVHLDWVKQCSRLLRLCECGPLLIKNL